MYSALKYIRLFFLLFVGGFSLVHAETKTLPTMRLQMGKTIAMVEIARTPEQLEHGLMYRPHLDQNTGMIFFMGNEGATSFWMKNTYIPLSIAFIDRNGVILQLDEMEALSEKLTSSESSHVLYVLEMNAKWFQQNHIRVGDRITPLGTSWEILNQPLSKNEHHSSFL